MADKKFSVGQLWKMRNGEEVRITHVADWDVTYPVVGKGGTDGYTYTAEGNFYANGSSSPLDLIELIEDAPAQKPEPKFKVGQLWKTRNGKEVRITRVGDWYYDFPVVGRGVDAAYSYTADGHFYASASPAPLDLVELIEDVPAQKSEPDADGWIAWNGGECPLEAGVPHQVKFRDTSVSKPDVSAPDWRWEHANLAGDIVAYRVIEDVPAQKPEPDADGWIAWDGGACPLEDGVSHQVKLRSGAVSIVGSHAPACAWNNAGRPWDVVAYRVIGTPAQKSPQKHSHYFKDVSGLSVVDVYRVCELFDVNDPSGATQHAIKKLLCAGARGVKDRKQDYREAIDALTRRLAMLEGE